MGSRVEEYLRRMRERGYQDSLMGMDDDDIEYELSKMEEADRRRASEIRPPVRTVYREVDPGLKARILRMFGQDYDASAIPKGQEFYLNGWDNGDGESLASQMVKTGPNYYAAASGQAGKDDWRDGGNRTTGGTAAASVTGNADWGDGGNSAWRISGGGNAAGAKQYVTADQLKAFGWQNVDDNMVKDLNGALEKYEITKPARIRHFLAQAAKESDMGRSTLEYGDDDYWNNNGYGRKYRGAGYIQMTWPDAYEKFAKEANDDNVFKKGAEYVSQKYPWQASAFWWHKLNHMNDLVDEFNDTDADADVERVTRRVNGVPDWSKPDKVDQWHKSLKERQEHYRRSRDIFRD